MVASSFTDWMFEWYPIFGVVFSLGLLTVFVLLLRTTMGSTRPETVKASKTQPVLWDEVQGVDAAKEELVDVAEWLKDPKRFAGLGARAPRGVLLYGRREQERRCWPAPSRPMRGSTSSPPRARASSRCSSAAVRLGSGGCSRRRASPGARSSSSTRSTPSAAIAAAAGGTAARASASRP